MRNTMIAGFLLVTTLVAPAAEAQSLQPETRDERRVALQRIHRDILDDERREGYWLAAVGALTLGATALVVLPHRHDSGGLEAGAFPALSGLASLSVGLSAVDMFGWKRRAVEADVADPSESALRAAAFQHDANRKLAISAGTSVLLFAAGALLWALAPKLDGDSEPLRGLGMGMVAASPILLNLDLTMWMQGRRRVEALRPRPL
ncbi:MAG: hypothetical protein RL385_3498 [Pseudomonadota bacterium]